jgi:cyclopropane-fatty-acyl-phospholipid synthase
MSRARAILVPLFESADIRIDGDRPWDLRVVDERFFARVLADGNLGLGESYMDGWWECEAIDAMICRALRAGLPERIPANLKTAAAWIGSVLINRQSRRRAHLIGERHYDLGNAFFAAMLDPHMQYSCAWFEGTDDLAEAQRLKMDLICRKLHLEPGMSLLDIGCGWGGLAMYSAVNYGCSVVGITVSREQQAHAQAGAGSLPVEFRLQDYRQVQDVFDRIVSVGMVEHVGWRNYRRYMEVAHRCLKPGGLFLCHTVAGNASRRSTDPWISRYVFPNSMLPSPAQLTRAAEGLFVLEDVHNFGASYDRTLMAWEANVRNAGPQFREHYGDRFLRQWRYYLLSCAGAFRARDIHLLQFVLSKGGVPGGYRPVRAYSRIADEPVRGEAEVPSAAGRLT